jgi:4-hydroxybenzoate polyprenyltransferase
MSLGQAVARVSHQAWQWVLGLDGFIRLHQLFFTAVWPLLGASSVSRKLPLGALTTLLTVTFCFHVFTYVLNDVIDLRLDRTQPTRQHDALVRGAVSPGNALAVALAQPLIAIGLTLVAGAGPWTYVTLASGFVLMGAYNLWGKRCLVPPFTDAIQGCAWGSLAIYGAQLAWGAPNILTWMVGGYVVVFTLLFNGVHGSLRDLDNDFTSGARTTLIFLGARPASGKADVYIPTVAAVFATSVLLALIAISTTIVLRNDFAYGRMVWTITTMLVGSLNIFVLALHPGVVRPRGPNGGMAWRLQLYLLAMILPIAFTPYMSTPVLLVLFSLNALALVLFGCTLTVAQWIWDTFRNRIGPSGGETIGAGTR